MDILFWSGGKDSYLALEFYKKEHGKENIKLLTTFERDLEMVPHQEITVSHIKEQARKLNLDIELIPLPQNASNKQYLHKVGSHLDKQKEKVQRLIFGDWHLQDIRRWREDVFGDMGYSCLFPIWNKDIHELLPLLTLKAVKVTISSVKEEYKEFIRVGEAYNQHFVQQLPAEIDPMGEQGEFHTKVAIQTFDDIEPSEQLLY